jgi:hypothetical protein
MEFEEESHEDGNHAVEDVAELNEQVPEQDLLVLLSARKVISIDFPLDTHHEIVHHTQANIVGCYEHIDQQQ